MGTSKYNLPKIDGLASAKIPRDFNALADAVDTTVSNEINRLDMITSSLASGSPKAVYATLTALQSAKPTGDSSIYLVTADGKWYYWNGTWTAGGTYQATQLTDSSITTDKLAFNALIGKKGKNLFDKSKVQTGKYISAANGTVQNSTGFTASDWIPIQPNTTYSLYKRNQLAFYDVNKAFLAFSDNTTATTVTSPANAVFLRVTTLVADVDLQQVEQGSARTSYEKFGVYLDEETVAPFGPDKIKDNSITKAKLNFAPIEAEYSKNLFNKNTVIANRYISASNGVELTPSAGVNVSASDWIAIKPNTQYTISKYNQTAVYDANKIYIASTGGVATNSVYTFTTPSNAAWLRMTTDNANLNVQQLELGAAATTYAEFGASIPSSALSRNSIPDGLITPEKLSFGIGKYDEAVNRLLLPPKMFFVDNLPLPLYRDNIFADNSVNLSSIFKTALINVDFNNGYFPTYQYFDEDIKLDPAKLLATFTIGVKQYTFPDTHYYGDILKSTVSATSKTGRTPKIINLGDSLTNRNVPARLKAKLEGYGVAPSVYGTMANGGGVNGEGREGWTFSQFIGKSNQIGGVAITRQTTAGAGTLQTNPFLKLADATDLANNPTWCFRNTGVFTEKSYAEDTDKTGDFYIFDFGYYLATQNFAIPDVVTIALSTNGITDLAGNRLALEVMIKQIKKACPSCKIGVIPTGAWGSNATGNAVWKTSVVPWVENCMTDVKTYQSSITGLDIVPIWCHVNRDFNFLYGAATSLSSVNATKKAQRGDYIHWGEPGKAEYANALSSYVMNVI